MENPFRLRGVLRFLIISIRLRGVNLHDYIGNGFVFWNQIRLKGVSDYQVSD